MLQQQKHMVSALVDMEFDGFRIDAIKHITEPMVDNLTDTPAFQGKYWFGEVLTGSEHDETVLRSISEGTLDLGVRFSSLSNHSSGVWIWWHDALSGPTPPRR